MHEGTKTLIITWQRLIIKFIVAHHWQRARVRVRVCKYYEEIQACARFGKISSSRRFKKTLREVRFLVHVSQTHEAGRRTWGMVQAWVGHFVTSTTLPKVILSDLLFLVVGPFLETKEGREPGQIHFWKNERRPWDVALREREVIGLRQPSYLWWGFG